MTGHGESHSQQDGLAVWVELRSVNNRYFKLSMRTGDGLAALEPRIESVLREKVRRGTVTVNLRVDRETPVDAYRLNGAVLASYRQQLEALQARFHVADPVRLETLLTLPGVVEERAGDQSLEDAWPLIERTLNEAVVHLDRMRRREGEAMLVDLRENGALIARNLSAVEARAPLVVEAYRTRITERLNALLATYDVQVDPAIIVREVGLFSEKCDISEEIVRLRSHLVQFEKIVAEPESSGRKLEFLIQEFLRETNTIGSKANDAEIAKHVIEMKASIERMREMIQNAE